MHLLCLYCRHFVLVVNSRTPVADVFDWTMGVGIMVGEMTMVIRFSKFFWIRDNNINGNVC